jgi:hypothetical protein
MRRLAFLIALFTWSCADKSPRKAQRPDPLREDWVPQTLTLHPPHLRKILDKLDVVPDLKEYYPSTDPYSRILTSFHNLDPAEPRYDHFLLIMPGGSGGEDLRIYAKKDTDYAEVQDFFAFFDTIPGTVNNGLYDIHINYRSYGPEGLVTMAYTWNGKKYMWDKCIAVNGSPYDTLVAKGLIDPSKTSENHPWVEWKGGE